MSPQSKRKYEEWDKYRKVDFELTGKNRLYWLKAQEMPAIAFRQCVCHLLVRKCKHATTTVGEFLGLDHATVMNCLEKYDRSRNHIDVKHLYDCYETIPKMETVLMAFEEFLYQKFLESDKPILNTIKHLNYMSLKKLRSVNTGDKYQLVISIMKHLNFELHNLTKGNQNDN